jgi:acyl-CoA reductase-like NAD-dependent aldehyde dehydrogenase
MNNEPDSFYYAGQWKSPTSQAEKVPVISPRTEQVIGSYPTAVEADVDAAVEAARSAFDDPEGWGTWSADRRAEAIEELASLVEAQGENLARLVSTQNGMPIRQSLVAEAGSGPALLRYYAGLIRERGNEELRAAPGRSVVVRTEPVGVVASIVPWNFPVSLAFMKLAPLLAAGCTTVLKPSEETALDSYILAECVRASSLPPGVVNIIPAGKELGAYLVGHPSVDKVTFTGSTAAGRNVAQRCGELLRPVSLELGGKSAAIVLDDADLFAQRDDFMFSTMLNSGQTCWLSTRILVPQMQAAKFVDTITDLVADQTVGDPLSGSTDIGPMVSSKQRDRVESFIQAGLEQGGRITTGGGRPSEAPTGWFVEPTVFTDLDNGSVVARNEIFGPVLCVIPYNDLGEAISIANDSDYGLGGTVWSSDEERALDVARKIQTGTIGINGFQADLGSPMGGVKTSGIGREMGPEGLLEYQNLKSIFPSFG